ncbi:MAG: sialidase family protein [Acidobacteriota bacterium]
MQQPQRWWSPSCPVITGTPAVTFSLDEGNTLATTCELFSATGYTYGLVALETANTLLAVHNHTLLRSEDAGCSWTSVAELEGAEFPPALIAGHGNRAYGWSDNGQFFFRVDGTTVTKLKAPANPILGAAVDPANDDRVRIGGGDSTLWESLDAGQTWQQIGTIRVSSPLYYRILFDPSNLEHIVVGTLNAGAWVTFDGGSTWKESSGISSGGPVNVFNGAISRADGNVVWLMALDIRQSDAGEPSSGRHIFHSVDGGESFAAVVDRSADVNLINGPVMAAHPTNPDVLYFVFGTYFQGYGTDLFRYDAATRVLSRSHSNNDDINAIAFSPASPSIMYLGLETEQIR